MPKQSVIRTHLVKHIWEAYAKQLLAKHPEWEGEYHNKTYNYYLYNVRKGTKGVVRKLMYDYPRFRRILDSYFDRAKTAVVQGEVVNMLHGLGKIFIKRVERDFTKASNRRVDYSKTFKYTKEHGGKVWNEEKQRFVHPKLFFFTDDSWLRIGWYKDKGVANLHLYEFYAASASSSTGATRKGRNTAAGRTLESGESIGFIHEMLAAVKKDPGLKYRYLYFPIYVRKYGYKKNEDEDNDEDDTEENELALEEDYDNLQT